MQKNGQLDLAYGSSILWDYENGNLYVSLVDGADTELWNNSILDDSEEIGLMDEVEIEEYIEEVFGREIRKALNSAGLAWDEPKVNDLKAHLKKLASL